MYIYNAMEKSNITIDMWITWNTALEYVHVERVVNSNVVYITGQNRRMPGIKQLVSVD